MHSLTPRTDALHVPRYYRNSLELLKKAAVDFKERGVDFGCHLGDVVDGKNRMAARDAGKDEDAAGRRAVGLALDAFGLLQRPWKHTLGNHCLYTLKRDEIVHLCDFREFGHVCSAGGHTCALRPHLCTTCAARVRERESKRRSYAGWASRGVTAGRTTRMSLTLRGASSCSTRSTSASSAGPPAAQSTRPPRRCC